MIGAPDCDDGESQACRDYKAILADHAVCDPEYATPVESGSYAGYRCLSEDELTEAGLDESLEECTAYLEGLVDGETTSGRPACEVPIGEDARRRCKDGYLAVDGELTLPSDAVGSACTVRSVPPTASAANTSTWTSPPRTAPTAWSRG